MNRVAHAFVSNLAVLSYDLTQPPIIKQTLASTGTFQTPARRKQTMAFSAQPSLTETEISLEDDSPSQSRLLTLDLYPLSHLPRIRTHHANDDSSARNGRGPAAARHKVLHFIRHAEGTHNVNREYRDAKNLDARLTSKGIQQCAERAAASRSSVNGGDGSDSDGDGERCTLGQPQLVVTSTMTRCIQTALLSFPHLFPPRAGADEGEGDVVSIVAHESIRETVNYACDRRRPISTIAAEFPAVDFSHVASAGLERDEIWHSYDDRLGPSHDGARESAELHRVAERGREFFDWLRLREEEEVVVCGHSAFFRCIFGWGQPGGVLHAMEQVLDSRDNGAVRGEWDDIPIFRYCGDDASFEIEMRRDYSNCEMRSLVAVFPPVSGHDSYGS